MNLIEVLQQVCGRHPDKTAFIAKGSRMSYRAFYGEVEKIAGGLREAGIAGGDRVLALMPLSTQLYATLCAVWALGASVVVFDPSAGRAHVQKCLEELPVKAFVGNRKSLLLRWLCPPIGKIAICRNVSALGKKTVKDPLCPVPVEDDTPALITFTSGSTAQPKAIVRSHGFLLTQHAALVDCMPYREDDVDLAVLPVFTLINLVEGITTVLPDDSLGNIAKVNAARLAAQIQRHSVTRITASPALLDKLCAYAKNQGISFPTLRSVHVGGGPVFLDILERMGAQIPPQAMEIVYGSTEAEPISTMSWTGITSAQKAAMKSGKGLLVGKPVDSIQIMIMQNRAGTPLDSLTPQEFQALGLPWEKPGEIVVAGGHVVQGYLRQSQDRENKIQVNGTIWHRTGDCGYLDGDGYLWLLGRAGQVLRYNEVDIYPFAVESAIRASFGCRSAICADPHGAPVLVLEQGGEAGLAAQQYTDQFHRVVTVKQLPMDRRHASKVDYVALRKLIS